MPTLTAIENGHAEATVENVTSAIMWTLNSLIDGRKLSYSDASLAIQAVELRLDMVKEAQDFIRADQWENGEQWGEYLPDLPNGEHDERPTVLCWTYEVSGEYATEELGIDGGIVDDVTLRGIVVDPDGYDGPPQIYSRDQLIDVIGEGRIERFESQKLEGVQDNA